MALKEKLQVDLQEAQKARDRLRTSTLRMVLAEVHNREIEKKEEASDDDIIALLAQFVKKHQDSIAQFRAGGRDDLVLQEEGEMGITKSYLPEPASEEELRQIVRVEVRKHNLSTNKDFGKAMAAVMPKVKGRAAGEQVAKIVKEELHGLG